MTKFSPGRRNDGILIPYPTIETMKISRGAVSEKSSDTIAAIATPPGEGAIGIVRISGSAALQIADRIFRGKRSLADSPTHTVHHGFAVELSGERVDEILATVFRSPHSYTGENLVEIGCHGGLLVTSAVLQAVLSAGARAAEPGEFTKRAFLNGKLDLSQAEAVADLIASRSSRAQRASLEQLEGKLAGKVKELKDELLDLCSLLELDLDFSEERLEIIAQPEIAKRIAEVDRQLRLMEETFLVGRILRDGVSVVIAGKPNAGKSSLFNALLKEDRAIVTHVPGTTRDSLEESISIHGVLFRLTDTAGLRETQDVVEAEGIQRSRDALRNADIVVLVVDSAEQAKEGCEVPEGVNLTGSQQLLVVFNKVDLHPEFRDLTRLPEEAHTMASCLPVSAKTGEGLERFRQALYDLVFHESLGNVEPVQVTSIRHVEAIRKARTSLATAERSRGSGLTNEFVAFDVRVALHALSEITGEVTSEDVLNNIFGRFCIGK